MPAKLINGKFLADEILKDLRQKVVKLNRPPGFAVILVGNDPASQLYVRNKKKACEKVGITFNQYLCGGEFCPQVTEEQILRMIDWLNADPEVDGIIVQLPIPQKFDTQKIIEQISPAKDVDSLNSATVKKFMAGEPGIISPLVQAINAAIISTHENLAGKNAVIISNNAPYAQTRKKDLQDLGMNVEIISPAGNLAEKTKQADVLVVIAGQRNLIKKSMVKPDAIVIDVGTNAISENEWVGDVDSDVAEVASWLTPVPGGIGPLTVAFLLKNTYELAQKKQG